MTGVCQYCGEEFFTNGIRGMKYCCAEHYHASRHKSIEPKTRDLPVLYISDRAGETRELRPGIDLGADPAQAAMTRIFMVCGPSNFSGKFDAFSGRMPHFCKMDARDGDTFIFCDRSRHQIAVLQWQSGGVLLLFKRLEHEQFPWVFAREPKVIEITPDDLKLLLEYPRFMKRLGSLDGVNETPAKGGKLADAPGERT